MPCNSSIRSCSRLVDMLGVDRMLVHLECQGESTMLKSNSLELVSLNSASWNPLTSWLRRIDHLRGAA